MIIFIGGIVGGVMTATEAAAAASVWVVIIGWLFYRPINFRMIMDVTLETALLTAVVMFCVGTATLFGWLMAYYQIIDVTENLFQVVAFSGPVFLLFATVLFLFLGTFMDPAPAMLIFVPVMAPVATRIGVNPLQLGIIVAMALAIGKITLPFGIRPAIGIHDRRNPSNEIHEVEFGFLLLLCVANDSRYILAADNTVVAAHNSS
jgi:TRAP-type C4-dicarboxylate transport system permease large subunit